MPRYRVTRRYSSAGYGPWQPGAEMDLSEQEARWLDNDSAGLLVPVVDPEPEPEPSGEPEPEAAQPEVAGDELGDEHTESDKPPRNRKHSPQRTRS